jgi:Uma2 family endonuclease
MVVMTTERPLSAVVRALHDELDPPEGYRVEIIEGKIDVAASPFGRHAWILRRIRLAIEATLPPEFGAFERVTLEEPETDRYEPDLGVWPDELIRARTEWVFPGSECLLAVEVTSPNQERRDYSKAAGYARSGTAVYLIVDQSGQKCVVFSEPEDGEYRLRHDVAFGKPITLPLEPPVTIETSEF